MRLETLIPLIAAAAFLGGCASGGRSEAGRIDSSAGEYRIKDGLTRLGASEGRGDCFARRIAGSLDERDEEEAAKIVEAAASKAEMRAGVLGASERVRRAFIGANFGCSLFS